MSLKMISNCRSSSFIIYLLSQFDVHSLLKVIVSAVAKTFLFSSLKKFDHLKPLLVIN